MGTSSDRIQRLSHLRTTAPGFLRIAWCKSCSHMAPFPLGVLIRRLGETHPVEAALWRLRCEACGARGGAEARLLRLCDPGCPKQRG